MLTLLRGLLRQWSCFHHDPHTGASFLDSQLIDTGRAKLWWCTACERSWIR